MRAVSLGDLDAAARAVMGVPPAQQPPEAARLIAAADLADRYRRRLGRAHPRLGDGALMTAAQLLGPVPSSGRCDGPYCRALAAVLAALERHRARHHEA